jgi:hypothetical protein
MSTTNTTQGSNTSTLQFNPIAQGIYNQLIQGGGKVLGDYMNAPLSNPYYNLGAAQSQRGAQQAGQNNIAALGQNMLTSGISGQAGAGFKQAQLAQTGRANQAMSSQANVSNVLAALQRQMAAAGTGLSFSPQLTGQTGNFNQSQTQSGLGTWLPQLLSAAGGAAMGGLTGGASMLGGAGGGFGMSGGFAGGSGGAPAMNSSWLNSGNSGFNPYQSGFAGSGGLGAMLMGGGGQAPPPPWMQQV